MELEWQGTAGVANERWYYNVFAARTDRVPVMVRKYN